MLVQITITTAMTMIMSQSTTIHNLFSVFRRKRKWIKAGKILHTKIAVELPSAVKSLLRPGKDIKIKNSSEVVKQESQHRNRHHFNHTQPDVHWRADEVLPRLHRSTSPVKQLVDGTQIQRKRTHARDHHEHRNDHVPDRIVGNGAQDVVGNAIVGLVDHQEHDSDEQIDRCHGEHGEGNRASDRASIAALQVLLAITSPLHHYHLRKTHQREGERVHEHSQIAQNPPFSRIPERRFKLEAVLDNSVHEQDDQADHQSDQAERRDTHQQTR